MWQIQVAIQKGLCAACRHEPVGERRGFSRGLRLDHDHKTRVVRGIICDSCNRALGLLHDDPGRLRSLLVYLESPPLASGTVLVVSNVDAGLVTASSGRSLGAGALAPPDFS